MGAKAEFTQAPGNLDVSAPIRHWEGMTASRKICLCGIIITG
jgi:hypothetical protein